VPILSPYVISGLSCEWKKAYVRGQCRGLLARRYGKIRTEDVHLQARMEPKAACMLVILGATPEGGKKLVGVQVGVRESARDAGATSWSTSRRAGARLPRISPWGRPHGGLKGVRRSLPRPAASEVLGAK
jgi:hypothetical protein